MNPSFLLGISGASGSGKTEFSKLLRKELASVLGAIPLVCDDDYYLDQSHISFEEREKVNYDHPDSLDHSLLIDHLRMLKQDQCFRKPIYDFPTHTRSERYEEICPAPVVVLEGILIFHPPELRDLLDWKIFVNTAIDVCLDRRIRRDVAERGRTEESVRKQFESTVRPMFHKFVEPAAAYADQVVSGEEPFDEIVRELVLKLRFGNFA